MPFSRIAGVRLYCAMRGREPIFSNDDRPIVHCCELRLADKRCILLSSDLAGRYLFRDFVSLLHQRLVPIRRRIKFRAGLSWPRFLGWLFDYSTRARIEASPFIMPLFPFYAEGRLTFRRNRPRRYRPDRIPNDLLP